jgi:hypothetical protein
MSKDAAGVTWVEFDRNRSRFLQLVADQAELIANQHLRDENFHRLIKIACDGKIVSAAQLGEIGRRDPTTASRWINGHSTPDSFAQEAILKRIAIEARRQAENDLGKVGATVSRRKAAPR